MNNIILGNNSKLDLDALIDTRLLIQANSGGGKSWCIRRLLEQTHGKVQQIVIDLEGEFSTLREKHDYILAGKGGDTPAEPRSAALLAKRLLELNVSAIVDLYELEQWDRKRFVKLFLDALVDAPKDLWHPCIIVIDEAHVFCPEKGQSEAMGSVIDLATRGRKRGFCAVLATQRLSKLHKDAAAECNNKLIGRTGLDVDMKRASEELGFTSKEQYLSLRSLDPGEFFAFGPALSTEVKRVKIGEVRTTHPKAGSRILTDAPVPPTAHIKSLLAKLGDLPKEAEEEAKTIEELKKQIVQLKRQSSLRPSPTMPQEQIDRLVSQAVDKERREAQGKQKAADLVTGVLRRALMDISKRSAAALEDAYPLHSVTDVSPASFVAPVRKKPEPKEIEAQPLSLGNEQLGIAAKKIYTFLYANPDRAFTKVQLGAVTGYSPNSGGFNNSLSMLSTRQLITRGYDGIQLLAVDPSLVLEDKMETYTPEIWFTKLGLAPRKIFEIVWREPEASYSKELLGELTGYSPNSGGFNNSLSKLSALGLIIRDKGVIRLNPELKKI